jgi:hypothetical protein
MMLVNASGCAPDLVGVPKGALRDVVHYGHFPPSPIAAATLKYDAVLPGIPCRAGDVGFSWEGQLQSAVLSRDFSLGGHTFPAGTRLEFLKGEQGHVTRESFIADPPGPFSIAGMQLPEGTRVGFESRVLDRVKPGADIDLDGKRYPVGVWVRFDKSGRVSSAQ